MHGGIDLGFCNFASRGDGLATKLPGTGEKQFPTPNEQRTAVDMRHNVTSYEFGDRCRMSFEVDGELVAIEPTEGGRLLTLRVLRVCGGNGAQALWSCGADGVLELVAEASERQRILALGLSARQRAALKKRLSGLSCEEADKLLSEFSKEASVK
ncbi:hypothetical protein Spa11_18660 [Botrimarina mediterranea]|uniref:Uncharacterized protein n=1 Tax=Botrimarina mediterranea TaxID=2528022 RepID=A0A518K7C9_9BACT|nr:hypothetical protein Spa11_18660 [Botrimarina mediterranea]